MKRKDWLLIAVSSAKGKSLSRVQLQKTLFLLGGEFPGKLGRDYYRFIPYYYGPFDQAIYYDAEDLAKSGLISIATLPGRGWVEYSATPAGLSRSKELEAQGPDQIISYLRTIGNWARSLSFQQFVGTIYHHYPEFRVNSVFRD